MAMLKRIRRVEKKVVVRAHDALRRTAFDAHRDLEQELARVREPTPFVFQVLTCGTCARSQPIRAVGVSGGVTVREAMELGWVRDQEESWSCPFCSGPWKR